jgi:DNA-binding MarR family transcriptional regulator
MKPAGNGSTVDPGLFDEIAFDFELPPAGLCNGTALRKATRRISQLYDTAIAPCGLRSTQRAILIHIARAGTPTMSELAATLVLDRSALAHNMKPLLRDGLVRMAVSDTDKRSRRVALTEAGAARLKESMGLWRRAQQQFETAFGQTAAADLRLALERIASDEFAQAFEQAGAEGPVRPNDAEVQ